MNEEALQQLYILAQGEGYSKPFNDFKILMSSNEDALNNMYTVAQSEGYQKNINDFKVLVGFGGQAEISQEVRDEFAKDPVREAVKKKDVTESLSEDGLSDSQRKSKEIFEQIGTGFQRVPEEDVEFTEQSVAQMDTPVSPTPSRRDVGTIQAVDFTGDRFDLEQVKTPDYKPTEEEAIVTSIRLSNPKKKIITVDDIDSFKKERQKEEENTELAKRMLLESYNSIASQQNLETLSISEYDTMFDTDENLDSKMFEEFSSMVGDDILTREEINDINQKNSELIAQGKEPVSIEFYKTLKKNQLFKKYIESENLLPSQRKQRFVEDLLLADSRLLSPSSEIDLTLALDDETRNANVEKIHKNKLKRDFIIENISPEIYNENKGKLLTSESYDEIYKKALENFYQSYGDDEWETYKKISGNTDPLLIGTEYENDNKERSLLNEAVVIGDEDATVKNLQAMFPEFRFEGTGITGQYVTISTVSPDGGIVKSLEIFLEEENEPVKRIREFMQQSILNKKDKEFLSSNKDYSYYVDNPLWRLEMYDYMLSNPQKFGDQNSPSMYGKKRDFHSVNFNDINKYLDQHKDKISDKMMAEFRKKMAQADAFYKGELAQKGTLSSAIGAGFMEAAMSPAKFVSMTGANIYDAFGGEGAKEAKDGLITAIESSINQISGTTPESIAERDLLQTVLNTMINSGTHMALGMGNPYATFGSFLMASAPRTERLLKDEDIPEYQKGLIGLMMGSVEGVLETYGAQNLITPATSGIFKKLIIESLKDLPSNASQEAVEQAVRNSVKTKLLSGGLKVAEGMIYEGATEGTQALAEDLNKRLFNAIYDKEIFQVPDWTTKQGREQWAEQIVEQVKIGGLAGGGFASVFHGTKSLAKGYDVESKERQKQFEQDYNDLMDDTKFQKSMAEIKAFRTNNQLTEEEYQILELALTQSREIAQSIPETLSLRRKMEAFNLLKEKKGIQSKIRNKSSELVASQEDRIKEIDGLLKIVGDINISEENVKEEIDKTRPETIEDVTESEELENIMKPKEAPVTEETTEEAPVTEEERAKMREILGEPAAQEQAVEEAAPVVEEAPRLLNKEQKEKYLKLSKEERDALDEIINDEELERNIGARDLLESEQIEIEDEMFSVSSTISFEDMINQSLGIKPKQQKADGELFVFGRDVYDIDAATKLAEQDNVNVVDIPVGTLPKMRQPLVTKTKKGIENADLSKPVIIATTNKGLLLIDGHHRLEKAIRDGKSVKAQILSENQTKNIKTQEQVVEKAPVKKEAPVKEVPKRKRRRKKVAPAVKEEVKVSEKVTTPIAKPKVVVSGTSDGYQVVSSANTTQAENESIKDARGDKTFDKDGFRITKQKDGSSQVSYKSKVRVSDKGNRPGYAMATVIIPEGSPVNKQQIQEAFDNKLSEIIESNRKKKLGTKFSELTTEQNQQLTNAVVNAISQEQVVKEAPKKTTKKKAPVKEEPQVSEEVQKEIDRAERLKEQIIVDKRNELAKLSRSNLTREQRSEKRENLEAEIRQAEKRYNNIITELKEGKRTRFRLSDDAKVETEEGFITEDAIVEVMKGLGSAEMEFKIPVGEKQIEVDPIALSKSLKKITDAQAKKLGFKSVADMLKNIEEFNGIPMVVAMSDILAAGIVKDSMGNDMEVGGGLLYNVLGPNKTLAWAGVNKDGANTQFEEAKAMYRANKELFDRLWKEGKLPKNHVPMVVVRMDNAAINSNEAMFRFMAPKLKSFPKKVQKIAFDTFLNQLESKKKTKSVEPALIEAFIKKNKIKDLGTLFDLIVEDAKKRAKGNEDTFALTTKGYILDMIASPVGVKKASKPVAKAIMNATDYNGEIFLIDHILSKIGETSMVEGERGDAVAIMGVDVSKNGGVTKAKHNNYGFGPKGRLIALIKNPTNVLQIFPEWRTKAFKMFEVKPSTGEMKTDAQVLADVYGQVFGDKAFRGSRLTKEMSDIDMVSAQMRFAFPSVSVSQSQQEFDEVLKQEGIRTAEANGNTILGLTKDGKIFLNPSRKSLSTPIHEFGHIWIDYLRSEESGSKGSKLLDRGLELVEGTKALESAIKKYGDNALAREEALVELMGTKGETIANAAKRAKFVEWFNAFFKYIKEKLTRFADIKAKDIKDITLEEFVDIGLAELFSGEAVDAKFKPEEAAESVKARMQKANIKPSMSAQNIIKKARAAEEPIRDAVIIDYLMSEKNLTRKQAISELKRANRGDLKDAVKRLFNNVEDITDIKEKDAQLIKDILKFDRSITRADKIAQKKAKDEIKIRLKAIQRKSKGKLSQAQVLAVTNRFANVNLSSEKSIDSFVDYMQKVFSDVDYAAKMTSLNKSITDAKTNINSKIGRGADGLASELRMLLNISPTIIPDSVFEEYSDLVTSFGERKTVLDLKDSVEVKETIAKIFTELENQNSKLGELTERFEAFDDKKFTKTGAVSFSETVAQMVKDKVITEDEAKLMRKFKSDIMPIEKAEGKTEEDKEKEMEEEKKILIENIKKSPVDVKRIPIKEMRDEYNLAKQFSELIKTNAVNELNNAQLKNIQKAIDNINNGYVTHYIQLAKENLDSINKKNIGGEAIQEAKPLKTSKKIAQVKAALEKGANVYYKMIERNPLINIDMVLGDFSSKRIFNSVLEESAEAVTTFNTELNKVYNTIEDAEVQLQKKFEYLGNKILESKYKQMVYMVQQEFEANPNNPQVNPAAAVMKETIKKLNDTNQTYEAKLLEKILDKFSIKEGENKGEIDLKKLDDSFVYAELNMIKTVQDINAELTDKAVYTSAVLRGEAIQPLNSYVHQSVLNDKGAAIDDSKALSDSYMENIRPSTKAKNLIERTKGAKAINFDITASVRRGAKMTLMDYHLTSAFRTANRTLNKMEDVVDKSGDKRQIYLGVRDAYNQAIADILENAFTSSSISEQIFQFAAKQGYRSMLASVPRVFVELSSNYAFALNNPTEFVEGSKPKNMKIAFSEKGVEVMNNVNSKQTARMYGEELSGRFVESSIINKKMGMAADSAKNPVINRLNQGLSYLKKYPRGVEVVADFMITTPDKLVTRPMWFGSFATEFKKITGQEADFNKIAENDAEYMEKFEEAINEAKRKADDNTVLIGATDNPLMGILKNKKRASDKGISSLLKTINTFMQRFLLFEYNAFRKGMYAAMGRGDISPGRGGRLMLAVSARMTIYTVLMPILSSLIFGDDDDDDDESIYTKVYRGVVSTMTNLFIGRDFGAIVKMIQNHFIEWANEEYGRDLGLRKGKYDPFKNAVQFNIIPPEKSYKETDIASDILPNMLGPYTPLVKSLIFSGNKLFFSKPKKEDEARERQRREKEQRIPLELLGLTGLVPFYKDIRKYLNEDIYKGLRSKGSDDGDDKEKKKSGLRTRRRKKIKKRKLRQR